MVYAIQQIIVEIRRLTTALQFDPTYLQNYGLVLFNDNRIFIPLNFYLLIYIIN